MLFAITPPNPAMISLSCPKALRLAPLLGLALCLALAIPMLPLEHLGSTGAALGDRGSVSAIRGVLAHVGVRGDVRSAAMGRGAGTAVAGTHRETSPQSLAGLRVPRKAGVEVGEVLVARAPSRRSRPMDRAPHLSRASSVATPRAPPRV